MPVYGFIFEAKYEFKLDINSFNKGEIFLIIMHKFKIGDKVRLVSGSDVMTVCEVFGYRLVDCNWVGKENKTYKNSFRPDSLVLCERINDFNIAKVAEQVFTA